MTTAVPSKRLVRPNSPPVGRDWCRWLLPMLRSTVGTKFIVALTGFGLTAFVIAHLLGNLNIFLGREALNAYAEHLRDLGPLLWLARGGLLLIFLLHLFLSLRLRFLSTQARPVGYMFRDNVQAGVAARSMVGSGLVIFVFLLFHLAHYTFGVVTTAQVQTTQGWQTVNYLELRQNPEDPKSKHDVYAMTYIGFRNPIIAGLYIFAQLLLMLHLSHGVRSMFQSLGLNAPRVQPVVTGLGWAVALLVGMGNIVIVGAVFAGLVPPPPYLLR